MAPHNINTHVSTSNTSVKHQDQINSIQYDASQTLSIPRYSSLHEFENIPLATARRNKERTLSCTSTSLSLNSVRGVIEHDDVRTNKARNKLLKGIVVAASVSASALRAACLASTNLDWIGYSLVATTAYTSQVLLATNPVNSISHYFSGVLGMKENKTSVDGKSGSLKDDKNSGRHIKNINKISKNFASNQRSGFRRTSRIENKSDHEMITVERLSLENPARWQKIILGNRAVVVSMILSMYSVTVLLYLSIVPSTEVNAAPLLPLPTLNAHQLPLLTTTSPPISDFTTVQPQIISTINLIIERFGEAGTLILCHSINLMYNCQRLVRAHSRGVKIKSLIASESAFEKEYSFNNVMSTHCETIDETAEEQSFNEDHSHVKCVCSIHIPDETAPGDDFEEDFHMSLTSFPPSSTHQVNCLEYEEEVYVDADDWSLEGSDCSSLKETFV